jgi:hypothetical protein
MIRGPVVELDRDVSRSGASDTDSAETRRHLVDAEISWFEDPAAADG